MTENVITQDMILALVAEMEAGCPVFGILVIGTTGTGKSTLVNNILGTDSAGVNSGTDSDTSRISLYKMEVEGVPIHVYDTPGLQDSRGDDRDAIYLQQMQDILTSGEIQLVIYCLKLTETKMHQGLIRTFQEYDKIGVIWEQTLIALTFADAVPVPKEERKKADFQMDQYFDKKVQEWQGRVRKTLVENTRLPRDRVETIVVRPTTDDSDANLPNGKEWYSPLRITILKLLPHGAAMRFAKIQAKKVDSKKEEAESVLKIITQKMTTYATAGGASGVGAGAVLGFVGGGPLGALLMGGVTGGLAGAIGAVIGTGAGALTVLLRSYSK